MAEKTIPGGPYVAPGVRERIYAHVFSSLEAEVGGVLIGHLRDDGSPLVTDVIPALEAEGARARVTFTHEAWSTIHASLDRDHPDEEILGWYHSHPGFGIFLSDHDLFIHHNFFARPEQIAIVVDPHAGSEGLFVWRAGEVVKAGEEATGRQGERPEQIERALGGADRAPHAPRWPSTLRWGWSSGCSSGWRSYTTAAPIRQPGRLPIPPSTRRYMGASRASRSPRPIRPGRPKANPPLRQLGERSLVVRTRERVRGTSA